MNNPNSLRSTVTGFLLCTVSALLYGQGPAPASVDPEKTFAGHEGDVYCVAISPDNTKLATGSFDKTVRLWDLATGKAIAVYRGHEGKVMAVAFSPDGTKLASGGQDKTVRVWTVVTEAAEGDKVADGPAAEQTLKEHPSHLLGLAFSPNGKTIAAATGAKTVHLWNVDDGKETRKIEAHEGSVYVVAFSPDGQKLATGGLDKAVKLWNVADGTELKKFEGHVEGVFTLSFSRDGSFVYSGGSDRTIRKWNLADGMQAALYEGHHGWVCGLGVLPDDKRLVAVDFGGHVYSWDLEKPEIVNSRRLEGVVTAMTLSGDGKWIATAQGGNVAGLLPAGAE